MSASLHNPDADLGPLPQCGFGKDIDFDTLIKSNQFLFRVYTPKETSPFSDDSEPFFVAPRFNDQVARSPVDLPNVKFPETVVGTYAEVARHMEWTTKSTSCYLSTSFSFAWAMWEAVKRYHVGVKKDVQIAIIDASALGGRAATAVQLLMKSTPRQRDQQFWKWHRFSQDSQTVLVYGMVPRNAVLASIPLLHILRKMPSFFLRKDIQVISGNPLEQVAWDYMSRKASYRHFCQEMTNVFLSRPEDVRLRDSTGGAVRLALSFLRPFFHRVIQDDFDTAISYLRTLAVTISEWPGDGWVKQHPEVKRIVESMALALGEELREKYATQHQDEVSRLQLVISGLEQTIRIQNEKITSHVVDDVEVDSDGDFEVEFGDLDDTLVTLEPQAKDRTLHERRSSLKMSIAVVPRIPVSFPTPITPPESPRNSLLLPAVTIPLSEVVSTKFTFRPLTPNVRLLPDAVSPSITSPTTPASPPATPPPRSAVFSPPPPALLEDAEITPRDDQPEYQEPSDHIALEAVEEDAGSENAQELEEEIERTLERDVLGTSDITHHDMDDGEETDREDDDSIGRSPSPRSWAQLSSGLSSPRDSIFSVETLCDTPELPLKRWSYAHSRTNSFDVFGRLSPPLSIGMHSRTVSFSEPITGFQRALAALDPLVVPLPASPPLSGKSVTPSPSISRSSSISSCRSSPSSPKLSPSPVVAQHLGSDNPAPAVIVRRPSIIKPERRISLMAPLPSQDEDEETDTQSIKSTNVTETASYIVTGFLVGAFLTLFLFSTQRRTLLYVT